MIAAVEVFSINFILFDSVFFYTLPKFKFEISKDSPEFENENFHKDVN